ncbi:hypothetical protein NL676_030880 [Syzygium grande]|nr:hypothetical protein NL676_030880 [Syzygium grande]
MASGALEAAEPEGRRLLTQSTARRWWPAARIGSRGSTSTTCPTSTSSSGPPHPRPASSTARTSHPTRSSSARPPPITAIRLASRPTPMVMDIVDKLFITMFDSLNGGCKNELEAIGRQYPFEPLKYLRKTFAAYFSRRCSNAQEEQL